MCLWATVNTYTKLHSVLPSDNIHIYTVQENRDMF